MVLNLGINNDIGIGNTAICQPICITIFIRTSVSEGQIFMHNVRYLMYRPIFKTSQKKGRFRQCGIDFMATTVSILKLILLVNNCSFSSSMHFSTVFFNNLFISPYHFSTFSQAPSCITVFFHCRCGDQKGRNVSRLHEAGSDPHTPWFHLPHGQWRIQKKCSGGATIKSINKKKYYRKTRTQHRFAKPKVNTKYIH